MLYVLMVLGFALISSFACIAYCAFQVLRHLSRFEELAFIEAKERREYLETAVNRLNLESEIQQKLAMSRVPTREEAEEDMGEYIGGNRRGN